MPIRTTLIKMGYPQPRTPMQFDNSTAEGLANRTIKLKRSKSIDMHFNWVQDRVRQKNILINWHPGSTNLGDYHTKHDSSAHNRLMRPTYLHPNNQLANHVISLLLQGCVESSPQSCAIHPTCQSVPMHQKLLITQLVTNPGKKFQLATVCIPLK